MMLTYKDECDMDNWEINAGHNNERLLTMFRANDMVRDALEGDALDTISDELREALEEVLCIAEDYANEKRIAWRIS